MNFLKNMKNPSTDSEEELIGSDEDTLLQMENENIENSDRRKQGISNVNSSNLMGIKGAIEDDSYPSSHVSKQESSNRRLDLESVNMDLEANFKSPMSTGKFTLDLALDINTISKVAGDDPIDSAVSKSARNALHAIKEANKKPDVLKSNQECIEKIEAFKSTSFVINGNIFSYIESIMDMIFISQVSGKNTFVALSAL